MDIKYVPTDQMWSDILTKPKQGKGFRVDWSHLMNVPEDYDDEKERKPTDYRLIPPELDNPVLSHDSHGQSCRSVLEDIRKEHTTLKPRVSHNMVRGRTD